MNLQPIFARALTPELEAKLTPEAIRIIQEMNAKYEEYNGSPAYFGEALNLAFVYDNGGGRRIGVVFDWVCLDPSNDWKQSVYLFERLMGLARSIPSQKLIKIASVKELEEMKSRREIDFISYQKGVDCHSSLQYLIAGKPIKWENSYLIDYFNNPGYSNVDFIVKLDNGELISLGTPGEFIQTGTDPTYGPIYTPPADALARARAWASPVKGAIEHPRVVFVYWGSGNDRVDKRMSPREFLQYLNSLPAPAPEQSVEVQSAPTAIPSSNEISSGAEPGATTSGGLWGTFISSDWAWCVTRFPNDPTRQQQCLAELQRKADTEVPKSVIVGVGASAGTIALLLLAFGVLYLLWKGR
ncbi:MAG: hypothetical protein QXS54_07470 [Candidatus Methanomethylicaceae archaeon]